MLKTILFIIILIILITIALIIVFNVSKRKIIGGDDDEKVEDDEYWIEHIIASAGFNGSDEDSKTLAQNLCKNIDNIVSVLKDSPGLVEFVLNINIISSNKDIIDAIDCIKYKLRASQIIKGGYINSDIMEEEFYDMLKNYSAETGIRPITAYLKSKLPRSKLPKKINLKTLTKNILEYYDPSSLSEIIRKLDLSQQKFLPKNKSKLIDDVDYDVYLDFAEELEKLMPKKNNKKIAFILEDLIKPKIKKSYVKKKISDIKKAKDKAFELDYLQSYPLLHDLQYAIEKNRWSDMVDLYDLSGSKLSAIKNILKDDNDVKTSSIDLESRIIAMQAIKDKENIERNANMIIEQILQDQKAMQDKLRDEIRKIKEEERNKEQELHRKEAELAREKEILEKEKQIMEDGKLAEQLQKQEEEQGEEQEEEQGEEQEEQEEEEQEEQKEEIIDYV